METVTIRELRQNWPAVEKRLAAMEALGIRRLLTNDDQQAAAARALGFGVVLPR